jgi:hypothetical protein
LAGVLSLPISSTFQNVKKNKPSDQFAMFISTSRVNGKITAPQNGSLQRNYQHLRFAGFEF